MTKKTTTKKSGTIAYQLRAMGSKNVRFYVR